MLKARVRQVLTAGTAKQAVTDIGPKGHSLFTSYVLEGLNGAAAMFDKSIITASELMIYVRNRVAPNRNSKQTPAFSTLDTEPGGDSVFALPPRKKPAADLSRWVRILDQGPHGVPVSHAVVTAMEASLRQQEPLPPTSIIIPSVMKSPLTGELTFKPALSSRFQNKCLPDIANIYVSTFIGGNSLIETRMEVCSAIIMISYFILYTISASPCLI